jgi:hypothetical protein
VQGEPGHELVADADRGVVTASRELGEREAGEVRSLLGQELVEDV